jgi:hypothetical protein
VYGALAAVARANDELPPTPSRLRSTKEDTIALRESSMSTSTVIP